jgi:3-deoxy-7-phosphoheptulonate synthase
MFCERGVRTFDETTRNLLDLGAVALLSHVHKLPVIVDPSHGTGRRDLIVPLARAALAAGAAGVMIEVHDRPEEAQSDAPQALHPDALGPVLASLRGAS